MLVIVIFLTLILLATIAGIVFLTVDQGKLRKVISDLQLSLDREHEKYEQDTSKLRKFAIIQQAEVQKLSRWKDVADADAKAASILADAKRVIDDATVKANDIKTSAHATATNLRHAANVIWENATIQAKNIEAAANRRAQEIAGSAYEAMNKASMYEKTVKAMKHLIDGYDDAFLVPSQSLLDDLAKDFGHTAAGQELKLARERTKLMVQNGTAATCKYVEASRRDTAIIFVIDAFNGKVDSILSRVKDDNSGILAEEIKDACAIVNHNASAFREARISEEYLNARLQELHWAAVAQALKSRDKEEQRRIKEQIREEERARKEYERAMRESQKEQDVIKKAMEKAQERIDQATAEQRAKYENQLQELQAKLRETEERNKRAQSMAQQTRRGHVYVISNVGSFGEDVYKIGLTRRLEPLDRINELGDSSVPFDFDVHALIFSEDAPALERQLHKHFMLTQINKANHRREFFRTNLQHVREEIDKLNLNTKWTMTAEAREYHETLAIEKAIKADPAAREAWLKRQLDIEFRGNDHEVEDIAPKQDGEDAAESTEAA